MEKFSVIYKFLLITILVISLPLLLLSGLSLYLGIHFSLALPLHILFALLFISAALLHLFNRRSKLKKVNTQFFDLVTQNRYPSYCTLDRLIHTFESVTVQKVIEELHLSETALLHALREGRISITDTQQTLRQACNNNDEKIFLFIDIAMRLKFSSQQ
ncbi:transmembrane protein [Pasteurella multocida subsp. multocida OH4807]|nr:transmembrane protein [Pasteurella multocida subsp. multocida OH4807]